MQAGPASGPPSPWPELGHLTTRVVGGAGVNLLGILGRFSFLLFWLAATRLYGVERTGQFAVAYATLEVCRQFTASGFADGLVLFFARALGTGEGRATEMRQALAMTIWLIAGIGAALALAVMAGAGEWISAVTMRPAIAGWAPILVAGLPLLALAESLLAATRSLMVMKWHAMIMGGLHPAILLLSAVALFLLGHEENGLAWAWLTSCALALVAAIAVFARYFGAGLLLRAMARPRWHPDLLRFVMPQNINLTFNHFASGIDVLLLGLFQVSSASIALYAAGVQLTRNLRSLKVAMGASFGPVIARLHEEGRHSELELLYSRLSRYGLLVIIPPVLFVAILKDPLLALFDPSFASSDSEFIYILLALPLVACAVGLSGNLVAMTGHSGLNLAVSLAGAATNLALSALFIPIFGLEGAAIATLATTVVTYGLSIALVRRLFGIRTRLAPLLPAVLAGCLVALAALLGAPVVPSGWRQVLQAMIAVLAFAGIAFAFLLTAAEQRAIRRLIVARGHAR